MMRKKQNFIIRYIDMTAKNKNDLYNVKILQLCIIIKIKNGYRVYLYQNK